MFAETLRKYIAVYATRTAEWGDVQVLDYRIPKGDMLVIDSARAHLNPEYWDQGGHPAEEYWPERFLTATKSKNANDASRPTFSSDSHKGNWIPFGGGIHQCPGRHWVKTQMLVGFAHITAAFDIEIMHDEKSFTMDKVKYGMGAQLPAKKVAFRIRRKGETS